MGVLLLQAKDNFSIFLATFFGSLRRYFLIPPQTFSKNRIAKPKTAILICFFCASKKSQKKHTYIYSIQIPTWFHMKAIGAGFLVNK